MLVEVNAEQLECVAEYAGIMGLTIEETMRMLLDDWIQTVARAVSQNEKFNVVAMLGRASG